MKDTIAILGSNSFSGATFAAHCLGEGYHVLGLSRSEEPSLALLPYRWLPEGVQDRFRFVRADLNHDLERILNEIRSAGARILVNFASQGMVAESWENPSDWFRTNTVANVELHHRLQKDGILDHYVHVSTPEVYGHCEGVIRENANYHPSTPYATSRAACDMSLTNFVDNYGFPVSFTRAANVFGPGQQLYRIIPRTILGILLGKKLKLHGGGQSVRSFIHMEDVARATLRIAKEGNPGEMFHLSTTRFISIRDLVRLICEQMGVKFEDHVEEAPERDGKDLAYLLDSGHARERFGWSPEIDLEQGMDETIAWAKSHLQELSGLPLHYIHKK